MQTCSRKQTALAMCPSADRSALGVLLMTTVISNGWVESRAQMSPAGATGCKRMARPTSSTAPRLCCTIHFSCSKSGSIEHRCWKTSARPIFPAARAIFNAPERERAASPSRYPALSDDAWQNRRTPNAYNGAICTTDSHELRAGFSNLTQPQLKHDQIPEILPIVLQFVRPI